MPVRTLGPKGGGGFEGGPTSIGGRKECQQGRWARKGVDCDVPHRLEEGKSVNEDAGPRRGWIVMSHIGWGGEQTTICKGVETFP